MPNDKDLLAKKVDLASKQDTLIAGQNITIAADGKTISAANPTSVTVTPVYRAGTLVAAIIVNGNTTNIYAPAQHGDNANQNLAVPFSTAQTYEEGDFVIYQEDLYKCITAISTPAAWDSTKWMRALITNEMGQGGGGDYANQNIANTYDITATYDVGDYVIYAGLLYKCITAVETPGPFNATYWEHCVVTDEMGGGSGGGGNVDDVYVNGQSVLDSNKIAQIKSYKEVTQAEYDALPASKESDDVLYCITDQATADTTVAPIIYSEEEREVGVWTDGKPLYQKTFYYSTLSPARSDWVLLETLSFSIDTLVKYNVMNQYTEENKQLGGAYWRISYFNSNNGLYYYTPELDSYIEDVYVTIQYTKTTDQPGSGKYAPSGVPAAHYSENEQVVGTWIDGSTLYEKTLYEDLSGQAEHWYVYLDTLIDDINDYTIINFQGQLQFKEGSYIYANVVPSSGTTCYINRDSGRWYLYFHSGNATCDWGYITITIKYVKEILGQPSS